MPGDSRDKPKQPRDAQGRFARIVEHMGGVKIMDSRTTMSSDDDAPTASSPTLAEV